MHVCVYVHVYLYSYWRALLTEQGDTLSWEKKTKNKAFQTQEFKHFQNKYLLEKQTDALQEFIVISSDFHSQTDLPETATINNWSIAILRCNLIFLCKLFNIKSLI